MKVRVSKKLTATALGVAGLVWAAKKPEEKDLADQVTALLVAYVLGQSAVDVAERVKAGGAPKAGTPRR